ncbi:hypothetical protein LIPSTDRAFT_333480 [Lipomyces starkeyi NRRL Y-11557]|uniref:Ty3 transposon capsid-like protein domain-containing protein n=1 Tax=Lipomyces starkeyi NRRL Y-11557 TaxID=675824 RepID=A0A1E3Q0B6_LIPST|nr:hypothetical protein LIPSTDRAFT_333480 [Lipomyces starkeyi NRRL Y-11557]
MAGRSTRLADRTITLASQEANDSQVSSENTQQGEVAGASPVSVSTNLDRDTVDVQAPMGLNRMKQLIEEEALTAEQLQILNDRIRELTRAREGTLQSRDESDNDDDKPRKRRADHDLKYTNIKELKLGATLKQWTNWRLEVNRAFDGAPYKYDNDRTKVIKALMHLSEDCKTLWNNHIRRSSNDEYDWKAFTNWIERTVRDHGNFEMNTYGDWNKARQGSDQTPWSFDAYLTSLEVELEPMSEKTRAMDFLSKLQPPLQRVIELSGVNPLPQTRQEMVALATRMWEGLKKEQKTSKREVKFSYAKSKLYQNNSVLSANRGKMVDTQKDKKKTQRSYQKQYPKEFVENR